MQFSYPPRPSKKRTQWLSELKVDSRVIVVGKHCQSDLSQKAWWFWQDILQKVSWVSLSSVKVAGREYDLVNGKSMDNNHHGIRYLLPVTSEIISNINFSYFRNHLDQLKGQELTMEQVMKIAEILGWKVPYAV